MSEIVKNVTNVLHVALDFDRSSGVTTYMTMLLRHFKRRGDYQMHFITNGGNAFEALDSLGMKPVIIPMQRGLKNILFLPQNIFFIKRYCREHNIHIVHTHHRYPEFVASLLSKKNGFRTITTAHSLVQGYTSISFHSDKIIAVSNAVRNEIISTYNVETTKIETMYNCVEEMPQVSPDEIRELRSTLGILPENKIVLYVGRFEVAKGVSYIIQAFHAVREKIENVTLLIVGDGNRESQLTNNLENGSQKIILPPQNMMHKYYRMADIVVLPTERDSFPYVMLEAGLASKPFIGSSVDGIAEFIDDGRDGMLFPVGDVEKLTANIIDLLSNVSKAHVLGENLYRKVISLPTCEEYCEKIDSIYHDLLNS